MITLLKVKIRQVVNTVTKSGRKKYFLFALLGIGILAVIGFFFIRIFGFLSQRDEFPLYFRLFLSEKILMMVFMTLFLMLILSALVSALNIFFLSKDLKLLFSSPLGSGRIFLWKAIETAVTSSVMVWFFALPVLYGYCYYFAPKWHQILGILLVFSLYLVCGICLGILLGMIIPSFFSVRKMQPILSLVSIGLVSSIVIFLRLLRPEKFINPDAIENLLEYMAGLKIGAFSYFPFFWISRSMTHVAKGESRQFWGVVALFFIVVSLFSVVAFLFQRRFYSRLVDHLNEGTSGTVRSSWGRRGIRSDMAPLWKKEIKSFTRSPSQWSQLLIVAAMAVVFVLNIRSIPLPHPSVRHIIAYLNMGMAIFIVVGLGSRFTFTSIPMEGTGLAHVLASPMDRKAFFRFKVWFFTLPQIVIGLGLFFSGDAAMDMDPFIRIAGIIFILPMVIFVSLLALYFGLRIERLQTVSPQHLIVSRPGISYMMWSLFCIVAGLIYFIRPLFLYFYRQFKMGPVPFIEIGIWFGGFLVIMAMSCIFLYRRGQNLWKNREFI